MNKAVARMEMRSAERRALEKSKIAELAAKIEAAIPSAAEMDEMRREARDEYVRRSGASSGERFQDKLAPRLTAAKGYAGCIRVLCEQAEELREELAIKQMATNQPEKQNG